MALSMVVSWYENFHRRCRPGGGSEGIARRPRSAPGDPARDRPGGRPARAATEAGTHAARAPWQRPRGRSREAPPPPHGGPGPSGTRGQPSLNAVDSSVVVAAFATWHESHTPARRVVDRRELQRVGIVGGAVYDGLIAMTAGAHQATLVTLDRRANATYRRCGLRTRFLDGSAD